MSRICEELDKSLGFSDSDVAEYIIHLASNCTSVDSLCTALIENDAELPRDVVTTIFGMVKSPHENLKSSSNGNVNMNGNSSGKKDKRKRWDSDDNDGNIKRTNFQDHSLTKVAEAAAAAVNMDNVDPLEYYKSQKMLSAQEIWEN